jgi:hypothetical protein
VFDVRIKFACILLLSLLALGIFPLGFYVRSVSAQARPKIRIEPVQTMKVAVDETFTVNVTVEGCVNVYAVQVYIRYDPEVLEVVKILEGPFLTSFGSTLLLLNETKEDLEATPPYGEVRFVDSLLGDVPGASGSGLLFNVTFRVLSDGSSHLHFVEYVPKSGGDGTYFMDKNLNEIYPELCDGFYGTPITFSASATKVAVGDNVTLTGRVLGVTGALNVSILFRKAGGAWVSLANLTTDASGNFSYVWRSSEAGSFEFKASAVVEDVPVQSGVVAVTVESKFNIINYILYIVAAVVVVALLAVLIARRRRRAPPETPPPS